MLTVCACRRGHQVQELVLADSNVDGVVDDAEYHRFKVTNDGDVTNDNETLDDALHKDIDDAVGGDVAVLESKLDETVRMYDAVHTLACLANVGKSSADFYL